MSTRRRPRAGGEDRRPVCLPASRRARLPVRRAKLPVHRPERQSSRAPGARSGTPVPSDSPTRPAVRLEPLPRLHPARWPRVAGGAGAGVVLLEVGGQRVQQTGGRRPTVGAPSSPSASGARPSTAALQGAGSGRVWATARGSTTMSAARRSRCATARVGAGRVRGQPCATSAETPRDELGVPPVDRTAAVRRSTTGCP
jgi:hypothetical protein